MVVAFEFFIEGDDDGAHIEFAHVGSALAGAGGKDSRCNAIRLKVLHWGGRPAYPEALLQYQREAHIAAPIPHFARHHQCIGMLSHKTEQALVADVCGQARVHLVGDSHVRLRRLGVELVGGDRFKVLEAHDVFATVSAFEVKHFMKAEVVKKADRVGCDWLKVIGPTPKRAKTSRAAAGPVREDGHPFRDVGLVDEYLGALIKDLDDQLAEDGVCDDPALDDSSSSEHEEEEEEGKAHEGEDIAHLEGESVLNVYRGEHDAHRVCAALGFEFLPNNRIRPSGGGDTIGHIRVTFEGRTFFAKCARHRNCAAMVQISDRFAWAQAWVVKWLIAGATVSELEHDRLKRVLRDLVRADRLAA